MRNFLAAVLSVIAVGVMLIAYGLLSPRVAASDVYPYARPMIASERAGDVEILSPRQPMAYRVPDSRAVPVYDTYGAPAPRRAVTSYAPVRTSPRRSEPSSRADGRSP